MSLKEFRRNSLRDKLDKLDELDKTKVELTEEVPDEEVEIKPKGRAKKSKKTK